MERATDVEMEVEMADGAIHKTKCDGPRLDLYSSAEIKALLPFRPTASCADPAPVSGPCRETVETSMGAPVMAKPQLDDCINTHCPWSGKPVSPDSLTLYGGHVVGFCNPGCRDKFEQAVAAFDDALKTKPIQD